MHMNKKILKGALAGTAVVALAAGGGTWASFSDFGNINGNEVGAGILKLNLSNANGSATTPLSFGDLYPGGQSQRAVFVASSDGQSVPDADLYMTIEHVTDNADSCSTNASEQAADSTCNAVGDLGELSRVLNMRVQSYAAPDALTCKGYVGVGGDSGPLINNAVIPSARGNLRMPPVGNQVLISSPTTPLQPGDGICVVFTSYWGASDDAAPAVPDNAAQGDSLTFDTRFDLEQHL
jgi:predicted ribosomally synthesized peptide with SipW-like signal peptide